MFYNAFLSKSLCFKAREELSDRDFARVLKAIKNNLLLSESEAMTTKRLPTFLAVILFMTAIPAFAYTVSQTKYIPSGIPDMNGLLTFNQFNNHSGIWDLNSIQISFTLQSSGGCLTVDNDSASPASGSFEFGIFGGILSTNVNLPAINPPAQFSCQVEVYDSQTFSLDPDNGDGLSYDPTPPDGLSYNGGIITDTNVGSVGRPYWTAGNKGFLGIGTYTINYYVRQHFTFSASGGVSLNATPAADAAGFVTVLYTYEVIPEPATITLLGTGILVFLLKRKRKKQQIYPP